MKSIKEQIEELRKKEKQLKQDVDYYNALQLALKLVLNGSYGALATQYFILFNNKVAGSVTAQGRDLTKTMNDLNEKYWYEMWHTDYDLHEKLGVRNVRKIDKGKKENEVSIYADTDSVQSDTQIITNRGTFSIEQWYNINIKNGSAGTTLNGHESVLTDDKVLNWNNGLYMANVKRIIRHEVNKPKWRLKTKSGKEIVVTDDHSMIVFRDGIKLEVKPSEILKTDKILTING
jgi:hypothetical protein